MKIKLDKLEQKDRGIVREVKIPKVRDAKLESDFVALLVKEKELDALDHTLRADEDAKQAALNKIIEKGQQVEYIQDRNKLTKAEIQRLADEQAKIVEDTQNAINEENAKGEKERRKQRVLDSQQVVIRANNKLKVFDERKAERDVQEEELKIAHKELDVAYKDAQENYRLAVKARKDNDKALSDVRNDILKAMKQGQKSADDDFKQATKDIEDIRKELKYKTVRPVGQNENEYIFLLVQPEEYEGDVISVKVEEKKDEKPQK